MELILGINAFLFLGILIKLSKIVEIREKENTQLVKQSNETLIIAQTSANVLEEIRPMVVEMYTKTDNEN